MWENLSKSKFSKLTYASVQRHDGINATCRLHPLAASRQSVGCFSCPSPVCDHVCVCVCVGGGGGGGGGGCVAVLACMRRSAGGEYALAGQHLQSGSFGSHDGLSGLQQGPSLPNQAHSDRRETLVLWSTK